MSDKLKKADKRLECSQCHYQLTPDIYMASKSNEVKCPRCNSAIVIDSMCATSCLTCQSNYKENHSSCTEKIVSIDITNDNQEKTCEISDANVEKNDHGLEESNSSMLLKAWQILKKRSISSKIRLPPWKTPDHSINIWIRLVKRYSVPLESLLGIS